MVQAVNTLTCEAKAKDWLIFMTVQDIRSTTNHLGKVAGQTSQSDDPVKRWLGLSRAVK
jgi:hypothetical protein